ncbi:MAG: PAN/Apple domain-containing protein, partial [Rhizobiaceae bacterium]
MPFFTRILSALFIVVSFSGLALAQNQTRRIELTENGDYFGFDLRTEQNVSLDQCQQICLDDRRCKAFTYNKKASWCFLKTDSGKLETFAGSIAGKVVLASSEPDIGAPQALDFTGAWDGDAQTYRNNLVAAAPKVPQQSLDATILAADTAIQTGDPRSAYIAYGLAVSLSPEDSVLWAKLSRAAAATTPNDNESYVLQQAATSAALNAYLTSRTTTSRADALVALAVALDKRGEARPALTAYKTSLELLADKSVEAAYKDLRSRKGFRVTENSVDTASETPRVCVQFSESLAEAD